MKNQDLPSLEQGFSLIELLLVIILLMIVGAFAVLSTKSTQVYAADDQALIITDIFQEARQKALTQNKTLRVELNDTDKLIRLIDEKETITPTDDVVVTSKPFNPAVSVGTKPANIDSVYSVLPQSVSPIPEIQYAQTVYPPSANDKVKTFRFTKTGEVVDDGNDNLGTNATNTGGTIYVYNGASGSMSSVVRAVTLSGVTAVSQLFKCQTNKNGICTSWIK